MKYLKKLNLNEKNLESHPEGYGYYSLCNTCVELSDVAVMLKQKGVTCSHDPYANFLDIQVVSDAEALMVSKFLTGDEVEGDLSDDVETDDAGVIRHKML